MCRVGDCSSSITREFWKAANWTYKVSPGWPDIAKQMFYEKALREILEQDEAAPTTIRNIFVFPGKTNEGPLTLSEIRHSDGRDVGPAFPPIECSYVSIRDALACYVSGSQSLVLWILTYHKISMLWKRFPRAYQPEGIAMLLIMRSYCDETVEQTSVEGVGSLLTSTYRASGGSGSIPQAGKAR